MDFKEKYLKLKKQMGGYRIIRNRDYVNQEIRINDHSTSVQIEFIVNKILKERLEDSYELGNFLYNFKDDFQIKELNNTINFYKKEISKDKKTIIELQDSLQLEKFAREQYLMKKENEDIYIIEYDTLKK